MTQTELENDPVTAFRLAPLLDAIRARIEAARPYVPGGVPNADDMRGIFNRVAREHGVTPADLERWWNLWGKKKEPGHG